MNKLTITILTDKNSYMNEYNLILKDMLAKLGHDVFLINSKDELISGDIAFFFSCFELIKQDKLAMNKYNIVIHESDLPKGKGWSPASWQILEGKNSIVLTAFEATLSVDAGDIYLKETVNFAGHELADEWRKLIATKKIEMALALVNNYKNLKATPQTGDETFYPKRTPDDCMLDVNKSIKEQFNLLRVVDNELYPAYFVIDGKKYTLKIYSNN